MRKFAAFILLAVALGFTNGRDLVPGLIWLVPGLMLALLRTLTVRRAIVAIAISGLLAGAIQWRDVVPLSPLVSLTIAAALGLILVLPYVADRLLAPRLSPMLALLVFPCAEVALEYALGLVLPYATWGAFAYTQATFPIVLQIASLLGLWIVSFVVALAAPAIAGVLSPFQKRDWQAPAIAVTAVFLTLVFGAVRLGTTRPVATAKVAGIASKPSDLSAILAVNTGCGRDHCAQARRDAASQVNALIARTRVAAHSGARVIVWSEAAGPVFFDREAALIAELTALARETHSWIAPALFVVRPGTSPWANKVLLIRPC